MKKKHKRMNMGGMTNDPRPMPAGPQPDSNPARPPVPVASAPMRTTASAAPAAPRRGVDISGLRQKIMSRVGDVRAMAAKRREAAMARRAATGAGRSGMNVNLGPAMKGGGLARKGVGQALKAGGAVRACGVAQRGKTKGKMV